MVEWSALPYLMEKIHYFAKPNWYMAGLLQECSNFIANTLKLLQPCTKIYFDLGQSVISKLKAILPSSWGTFWGPQTCPCSSRVCAQCPPPPPPPPLHYKPPPPLFPRRSFSSAGCRRPRHASRTICIGKPRRHPAEPRPLACSSCRSA